MDTTTSHLLTKLDMIDRAIGDLRREMLAEVVKTVRETQTKPANGSTPVPRWLGFLASASAKSAGQWIAIALMLPYLMKGGDVSQLLKLLLAAVF